MAFVSSNQPVFIMPPPGSIQQLEEVNRQMDALELHIAYMQERKLHVSQGIHDSYAFLRAQKDKLELSRNSMIAQAFPQGVTFVAPSGQAIYTVKLPSAAGTVPAETTPDVAGTVPAETTPDVAGTIPDVALLPETAEVTAPDFQDIQPIRTIYPTRHSTKAAKLPSQITVTILNSQGTKEGKKRVSPSVQQAVIKERRGKEKLRKAHSPEKREIPRPVTPLQREMNGNAVVLEPNGAVRINGVLYVQEAFRWWTDMNGNKFFVHIPVSVWNRTAQSWSMRILFSVPGMHVFYSGFSTDPCFERVGSLHTLVEPLLSRMWYVKVSSPVFSACCSDACDLM